jgi:hypothetical protein
VLDGVEDKRNHEFGAVPFVFSPDSKHLAYAARNSYGCFVVSDRTEGRLYKIIGNALVFSPEGQRLAYAASDGPTWFVVVNRSAERGYDGVVSSLIRFSPDGQHLVYWARTGEAAFLAVDEIKSKKYELGLDPRRLDFAAPSISQTLAYTTAGQILNIRVELVSAT